MRSPACSRPRACSAAIRALSPVPVAERSSLPGDTTTAFLETASTPCHGSAICTMLTPAMSGFSGCTHGTCACAAARIDSPVRERSAASDGSSANPSAAASAIAYHIPPYATSTVTVPSPSTSTGASIRSAKHGTFVSSTLSHLPPLHLARTSTRPAGASRLNVVSGSCISTIPVSSSTVATQIVFDPDMGGYSVGSMMMKPAAQSARREGTTRFACTATLPRGSRRSSLRRESSARSACICSKTVSPGGGRMPPTTTLPISPPAWHPTTVNTRRPGMSQPYVQVRPLSAGGPSASQAPPSSGFRDPAELLRREHLLGTEQLALELGAVRPVDRVEERLGPEVLE